MAELEEAWIVFALVREDGLSQVEAASLLGRHKSWVYRRLSLVERLCEEAKEDLRLGLLSLTAARQLVRLPAGNQAEVLAVMRREQLSTRELSGLIDLLLASATREKEQYRGAILWTWNTLATGNTSRYSGRSHLSRRR